MKKWSPWRVNSETSLITRREEVALYGMPSLANLAAPTPAKSKAVTVVLAVREGIVSESLSETFNITVLEFQDIYRYLQQQLDIRMQLLTASYPDKMAELIQMRDRLEDMSDKGNAAALRALAGYANDGAETLFPANRVGLISPALLQQLA